jgi:LuxR family maltose regulon positive regulatory protein
MRAALAATRLDEMRAEGARAYTAAADDSPLRALACLVEGVALHLSGDREAARLSLAEGERRGAASAPAVQVLCLAQLALVAIDESDWNGAKTLVAHARAQIARVVLGDYPACALVLAVSAAVRAHFGEVEACEDETREADRLLTRLAGFTPWLTAECRIALARATLRLTDVTRARTLLAEAERDLRLLPEETTLTAALEACRRRADLVSAAHDAGADPLTAAELRVLQFLPTHLSFPEIADELIVSRNTVKTHVRAVYRKLMASGRSDAVSRARTAGLLEPRPAGASPPDRGDAHTGAFGRGF